MSKIETEIEIDSPPETVWEALTDFDAYEEWNPYLTRVTGQLQEGSPLRIRLEPDERTDRTITAELTEVDPGRRLQWTGTAFSPWLFESQHTFDLKAMNSGRTLLTNEKRFSGILSRVLFSEDLRENHQRMNRALAERIEEQDTNTETLK